MALSTTPGAEIQRPLATVVIGGLVTSTLLTLLVLPSIYPWFADKIVRKPESPGLAHSNGAAQAVEKALEVPADQVISS